MEGRFTKFDIYAKSRISKTHNGDRRSKEGIAATKTHEKLHRDKYEEFYNKNKQLPNKVYRTPEEADTARKLIDRTLRDGLKKVDEIEDSHPRARFQEIEKLERR